MIDRTIEKMLYKIAALLAIVGIVLRMLQPSDNYQGLYLILAGHILGVIGILIYMKRTNDMEQEQRNAQEPVQQLEKK
ncbi:hypothetical protein POKO110462_07555 [Pontibacter korlensis]|uniref:Uncharacterized protein n=1 Tax=Pontibacter korlensis TaxID=400092 RepID=A0A0E3ZDF9_9BACT|nr:hypothetical protein [Pontibacter korlensis]AKD02249.1 hypothetical protein PKOR_02745 [Pontibacter korlensis]